MSRVFFAIGCSLFALATPALWAQSAYDYESTDFASYLAADDVPHAAPASAAAPGGCGPCLCEPNCCYGDCCCGPLWTVKAGAVIMTRARPSPTPLILDITGATLLDAADMDFNWAAGPDISIMRSINDGYGAVEARYFSIDGWQATQTIETPAFWLLPTEPQLGGIGIADVDAIYGSRIYSTEINYRHNPANNISWLVGFRWIELYEDMRFDADFAGGNESLVNFDTANRLYGGQIGLDWRIFDRGGPFAIDSIFKAGVFGNAASNAMAIVQDVGPNFTASDQAGQVAFVGEIGVTGVYYWTDNIAFRGGYQLLWVEGVAVAADQMAATQVITQDGIDTRGGIFYHGALLGIDFIW